MVEHFNWLHIQLVIDFQFDVFVFVLDFLLDDLLYFCSLSIKCFHDIVGDWHFRQFCFLN
jgi:hypothetical protein